MQKLMLVMVVSLIIMPLPVFAGQAKQPAALLQEARYAEDIDGNLDKAISIYEQIIKDNAADAATKAQAMYLQGMCYLKKQDEAQAQAVLSKLVAQYPQQTKLVERAQVTLLELTDSDPAAIMPPETLVYVEFGSPGKQIETIIKMLQGTPLEDPFKIIGQPPAAAQQGSKNPADIIAALLNPSMLAEFKKIRGMAVGVTEIKSNNPSIVAVLYPGKSDALRGLIMAAVNMAGQPAESIEGMNILNIQNGPSVAYDDNVFIIAQPIDLIKKSISLYKKKGGGNLAQNNKSFADISKEIRKQNVVTIWANVDQLYDSIIKQIPAGQKPRELIMAETFVDPQNIDELIARFSINEAAINFDAKLKFKDGYHGLSYGLFRTATLSKNGFANVPADAIALVSFAMNPGAAEKLQKPLQAVTGLDIGREIFENIEQITIFAVPPADTAKRFNSPVEFAADCLGVSITSKNPVQTRQILETIFGAMDSVAKFNVRWGQKVTVPTKVVEVKGPVVVSQPSQYLLPIGGREGLSLLVSQNDKSTILAFSPRILQNALSASSNSGSILAAGALQGPLTNIGPDACKLVLINAGGAIKLFGTVLQSNIGDSNDQQLKNALNNLEQLQTLFAKTYLRVQTNESNDSFSLRAQIEHIPPAKDVFPLVAQLASQIQSQPVKSAPAASPQTGKLVAYYKFDETKGSLARDNTPNLYHALLKGGAKWISDGKIGGALSFDGIDGYVDVEMPAVINQFSGGLTVIFWAKPESNARFARFFDFGNGQQQDNIFLSRLEDTNGLAFRIFKGNQMVSSVNAPNAIENGIWQQFAVKAANDGRVTIYRNGKKLVSMITSGSIQNVPRSKLYIGKSLSASDQMYKGLIDDFRIYNYVLSDDQVAQQYQSAVAAADAQEKGIKLSEPDGIVGWWKFDGNAEDSSGKGNNAELINGPTWITGKINGALQFDGVDDYASLPVGPVISTLEKSTIMLWTNFSGSGGAWQRIFDFGTDTNKYICLLPRTGDSGSGPLHIGLAAGREQKTELDAQTGSLPTGWHHIAVVLEPGNLQIYLDGKVVATDTPLYVLKDLDVTTSNWLGRSQYPDDACYKGSLDDLRIYDRALSEYEIAAIYEAGLNYKP